MMTETSTYLMIFIMLLVTAMTILKISRLSEISIGMISLVWGIVGYIAVITVSGFGNLHNEWIMQPSLMLTAILCECGLMYAWAFTSIQSCFDCVLTKILKIYPGFTILIPIIFIASIVVINFTGKSFSALGLGVGAIVFLIIFIMASLIKKMMIDNADTEKNISYCAIATSLMCIIFYGLKN